MTVEELIRVLQTMPGGYEVLKLDESTGQVNYLQKVTDAVVRPALPVSVNSRCVVIE